MKENAFYIFMNVFYSVIFWKILHWVCAYYADHVNHFLNHANFVLHLHQHFQKFFDLHGPLSSINTVSQENFIGHIKRNKNGTTSFENLFAYYYNIDVLGKNFDTMKTTGIIASKILFWLLVNRNRI